MVKIAILSVIFGILSGRFIFGSDVIFYMDNMVSIALKILVLAVGIDIGSNKTIIKKLQEYNVKILLIPFGVVVGSLLGGWIAGLLLQMPSNVSGALSAGLGWYSLSAILLKDMAGAQIGTTSFLCNIFRELIAFVTIPLVAKYLNKYTAIAPGGATSMDTTLAVVARCTDEEVAIMSVVSGVLCTALVPILVPLIYNLG